MFKSITLEVSLKPFKQTDDVFIRQVCAQIFDQWRPLLKNRDTVSIMFWTADGSEILDYSGNPDDSFEWCYYMGTANNPLKTTDDPDDLSLHAKKRLYMENPPVMTYRILKNIIKIFKDEGKKAFPNATICVGDTFDIGPEFAASDFKYNRHIEICSGTKLDRHGFIDSTALLDADNRKYAAYPNGIHDKTPFGTFLGKQSDVFLKDMGFDYLWLSNGLGFSANPWSMNGKIYDGKEFHSERLQDTREKLFLFWKLFREACPDIPLETRGTNNSVGIDYASDGVPLYDIYNAGFNITSPPNSPWAALNDDFGLEIMGHMTRICELPGNEFMFRCYIHDPWWMNSPWYDRYNGQPHDIYLPMAVSRIDHDGKMKSAEILHILSIDNTLGNMPDACVNEPIPHLLKAEKDIADEPCPLVWVYPMREFTTSTDADLLAEMYHGDRFISQAINNGFPLNCVVSTDSFLKHDFSLYSKSILISPIPVNPEVKEKLTEFAKRGGRVICYGSANQKQRIGEEDGIAWVDISSTADAIRTALDNFGYSIRFNYIGGEEKMPAMTIVRNKNGFIFSAYSSNTTVETMLKFPLGAPILMCGETELKDGYSTYRFARSEHRECRIFVEQKSGVITTRENGPVSGKYRRRFSVAGLEDATVCFFPETYCKDSAFIAVTDNVKASGDKTPEYDTAWQIVNDPINGTYYCAKHITGSRAFLMAYNDSF